MDILNWIRNEWDRVAAWVVVAVGGIALICGWLGVTATPYVFEQVPYVISGGLGGLFLLGIGAMLWISADLRDEWRKLDELVELQRTPDARDAQGAADGRRVPAAPTNGADAEGARRSRPIRRAEADA